MKRWVRAAVLAIGLGATTIIFQEPLYAAYLWLRPIRGEIVELVPHIAACKIVDRSSGVVIFRGPACAAGVGARIDKPAWSLDVRLGDGRTIPQRAPFLPPLAVLVVAVLAWRLVLLAIVRPITEAVARRRKPTEAS